MSLNSTTGLSEGIYQKENTEYDRNRLPHLLQTGQDDHMLKRSELIDTLGTEFSCPICLDLLKNTMVTECLHRFCSECIQKSIYKGNRECPTCRKKLISKRNLRADPSMDKLIDTVWPDRQHHEALQREKAQKWREHIAVDALQRSIAEGMREQARARVLLQNAANVNKTPLGNEHNACTAKRPCLRSRHVTKNGVAAADTETTNVKLKPVTLYDEHQNESAAFDSDSSSSDLSSSSSSSEESSSDSCSDGEENARGRGGLIVNVDTDLLNKVVDDGFMGRPNKGANIAMPHTVKSTILGQPIEEETSGVWSASSSSPSPSSNDLLRTFPSNAIAVCSINFGRMVPMETALREYVANTGQLGLITIELEPLGQLRSAMNRCRMKLMHRATVRELRDKFMNTHKNVAGVDISFFVQTCDNQMTRLHPGESMCTVLALGKRASFFDYPTVFFTTETLR
uniref:RING-type E3 ubiquitin transferase n=1 Tax=Globodera rostochiensis TaxID=31243 RepID=A0A914GUG4_GLORO